MPIQAGASGHSRVQAFDKNALLRAHSFFKDLGESVIERLAPRVITQKVKKGSVIFHKGDVGARLYAVRTGAVRVSAPSEQGKDAIFNLIVPGELFGEIAFLDGGQRTADAVAIDDCELMVIERRDFIPLIQADPELSVRLIKILCGRLRRTSEQVEDIVFLGLPNRLAKVLLHLYHNSPEAPRSSKIHITQREISQMIGVSRESANKQLQDWQRRKWIKLERGGVVICAPDALRKLIHETAE
ncbi:MAG TPA: Crp/Fnr family transcriptional regulator [Pseudolabrys sp.]|nr:Crp/Fnr family transcriptional regulator [Pseudolabrys sp.]